LEDFESATDVAESASTRAGEREEASRMSEKVAGFRISTPKFARLALTLALGVIAGVCLPVGLADSYVAAASSESSAAPQNLQTHPRAQTPIFKVQSEVVNVYAAVRSHKGRLVTNLTRNDFEITDNGQPQTVRYFARAVKVPLTMCLMIDTSPSQGRVLSIEQQTAQVFLKEVMGSKDMTCVLHFDVTVELDQDFTASLPWLFRAINEQEINGGGYGPTPGTFPGMGGATHLYDAIWLASGQLMMHQAGRKVLILLTDGQDQGSKETLDAALTAATRAQVIIYAVDVVDRAFYNQNMPSYNGGWALKKFSENTGGRVIRVTNSEKAQSAFREIADELTSQYLLGYIPTDRTRNGAYHAIRVRVKERGYRVQARRGYYAPAG
jgi:VWFA-related protein